MKKVIIKAYVPIAPGEPFNPTDHPRAPVGSSGQYRPGQFVPKNGGVTGVAKDGVPSPVAATPSPEPTYKWFPENSRALKYGKNLSLLNNDEWESVDAYHNKHDNSIDQYLKNGSKIPMDIASHIPNIDAAIEKNPLPDNIVLWRGINNKYLHDNLSGLVGKIIPHSSYTRASMIPSDVEEGMGSRSVMMQIRLPAGFKALYVGKGHMLLPRNMNLRISHVDDNGKVIVAEPDING